MVVKSGKCVLCDVGTETGMVDRYGKKLCTGDIVIAFTEDKDGFTDISKGLTVIVVDQYQSYAGGNIVLKNDSGKPFAMGIKEADIQCGDEDNPEIKYWWNLLKVKDHSDIIGGEHWKEYGFSYAEIDKDNVFDEDSYQN